MEAGQGALTALFRGEVGAGGAAGCDTVGVSVSPMGSGGRLVGCESVCSVLCYASSGLLCAVLMVLVELMMWARMRLQNLDIGVILML